MQIAQSNAMIPKLYGYECLVITLLVLTQFKHGEYQVFACAKQATKAVMLLFTMVALVFNLRTYSFVVFPSDYARRPYPERV